MLFKNTTDVLIDAYGYTFLPGKSVDVTEKHLINKFGLYTTLESAEIIVDTKKVDTSEITIETLKSQAIGLGLKVDGRWKEDRLKQEIASYGN